jgi:hemerythrin-like domain-containing protein
MKATQSLIDDHRVILKVVGAMRAYAGVVERGGGIDPAFVRGVATFLRVFADQCHHAKEEGILFPKLTELGVPVAGGPIGVMCAEHEIGRAEVTKLFQLADACDAGALPQPAALADALRNLAGFYEQHIWKEDNVLFPMADRLLTDKADEDLCRQYEKAEKAHGQIVHSEQVAFAEAAEKRFADG